MINSSMKIWTGTWNQAMSEWEKTDMNGCKELAKDLSSPILVRWIRESGTRSSPLWQPGPPGLNVKDTRTTVHQRHYLPEDSEISLKRPQVCYIQRESVRWRYKWYQSESTGPGRSQYSQVFSPETWRSIERHQNQPKGARGSNFSQNFGSQAGVSLAWAQGFRRS